uniref:Uncharacterized protein n=1 Tax=Cyprinodon variegatus TaxID=28743 RepID=A0A3Q2D892_CYPVA
MSSSLLMIAGNQVPLTKRNINTPTVWYGGGSIMLWGCFQQEVEKLDENLHQSTEQQFPRSQNHSMDVLDWPSQSPNWTHLRNISCAAAINTLVYRCWRSACFSV